MNICGIKFTHDGAVAGIKDGTLLFCVEAEKVANGSRYARIDNLDFVKKVLTDFNFHPDRYAVDGWKGGTIPHMDMPVAFYHEFDNDHNLGLLDAVRVSLPVKDRTGFLDFYSSYPHITGHILGAYCTAPFSRGREEAYAITWDGGQNPRVHRVDPKAPSIEYVGSLFEMYGIIYGIMGRYCGPYKVRGIEDKPLSALPLDVLFGGYEVPGKIMSYMGKGKACDEMITQMMGIYFNLMTHFGGIRKGYHQDGVLEHTFMRHVMVAAREHERKTFRFLSDADVLASVHKWLEIMLVENAIAMIPAGSNLCFSGGSALNIKWNSALRRCGHFKEVWVPPFPNDSGSAIGVACAEMVTYEDNWTLDWSVYCGPMIEEGVLPSGWRKAPCSLEQLAEKFVLHPNEPIVFLNGRAEVGPRALGNRSILMAATLPENKTILNTIKRREEFRPVAPICLVDRAADIFEPGTPDPYMLFDHVVRPEWRSRVPAIMHIDNTARLQTIAVEDNEPVYDLLCWYEALTGIPLLCNTSANHNGYGFFPDVASAMDWNGARMIWSDGFLYTKD